MRHVAFVFEQDAVSEEIVQFWFSKFKNGNELNKDEQRQIHRYQ